MGIQVLDQAGRVNAILALPEINMQLTGLCFDGADFSELYVTGNGKVYRRKLKIKGANAFEAAIKPAAPKL
jgi:gluconolactonase